MKLRINKDTRLPVEFPKCCKELIGKDCNSAQDEIMKEWKSCYTTIANGINGFKYAEYNNSFGKIVLIIDREGYVMDVFRFELQCYSVD